MDMSETIISLTGFMGSGKSSVGRELASRLGIGFIDLDERVEALAGPGIPKIFSYVGESGFRELELRALQNTLEVSRPPYVLALGGGTFTIDAARKLVLERTRCIFLDASEETIKARVGNDSSSRPLFDVSLMKKRLPLYRQAHFEVYTDGLTVSQTVDCILEREIV